MDINWICFLGYLVMVTFSYLYSSHPSKPHFHGILKNPQVSIDRVAWLNMMHVKGKGPRPPQKCECMMP